MSLRNGTKTPLSGKQLTAAVDCAVDEHTDEEIAQRAGVTRTTLNRWRELPEFAAEVERQKQAILQKALRLPIAKKHYRLKVLNDRLMAIQEVITERSQEGLPAAGAGTGLIVRDVKAVGTGRDAEIVDVFAVDVALLREERAIMEQAAKETGDWTENLNVTGTGSVRLIGVDPGDI
jgi:hypothetical protein